AVLAQVKPFLSEHPQNGFRIAQRLRISPDHEHQVALARAPIASCNWRVQKSHPAFLACRGDSSDERRRNGAGVYVNASSSQSSQRAIVLPLVAPQHRLERRGIADDCQENLAGGGYFPRRFPQNSPRLY